jgi:CMP-N-acetylneuraminic acid synthetase
MHNNILAITLARGGSKSVPRKNIKLLNGLPLIAYTINEAKKSKYINKYIVSTDDEEIKNISLTYGAEVPFLRPNNLSNDTASSADALIHAVNFMETKYSIKYDYIIELMCTNPLKTVDDIDKCIEKLIETKADSVIAVHKLEDHHPLRIKKIVDDHIIDFYLPEPLEARRQDLKPDAYIRSGSIYALKRDYLMDQKKRYGSTNSRPYILSENKAVNVDTELDFYLAEQILQNKF